MTIPKVSTLPTQNTILSNPDERILIPEFKLESFSEQPRKADLIVNFCHKYSWDGLKDEGGERLKNAYIQKFKSLEPCGKLEVLARIPQDFASLFSVHLPQEMTQKYSKIATSTLEKFVSINPIQLRLLTISKYIEELPSK